MRREPHIAEALGLAPDETTLRVEVIDLDPLPEARQAATAPSWWLVGGLAAAAVALAVPAVASRVGTLALLAVLCAIGSADSLLRRRELTRSGPRPVELRCRADGLLLMRRAGPEPLPWSAVEGLDRDHNGALVLAVGGRRLRLDASPASRRLASAAHRVLLARRAADWREAQVPEGALSRIELAEVEAALGLSRVERADG